MVGDGVKVGLGVAVGVLVRVKVQVGVGLHTEIVVNVTVLEVTAAATDRLKMALLRTLQGPPVVEK